MFDTPLDLDYGMRLDNIAYENMGVKEVWYIRDTVILLTSFEMEINGYFARPDHEYCYSRIYDKYRTYIFNCITKRQIVFDDGLDDETRKRNDAEGLIGFDLHDTRFYKNDIINHLANNKELFFDTESLYEYLSGCSDHRILITYTFPKDSTADTEDHEVQNILDDNLANISDGTSSASSEVQSQSINQYCFEKTAKGWNLQFEDVVLNGVKKSVGMDCVKYLLQRPGYKAGVLELETYLGTGNRESDDLVQDHETANVDDEMHGIDYNDLINDNTPNCRNNAWVTIDTQTLQETKDRLAQIDAEIKAARSGDSFNRSRIKRLEDEQAAIENYLNEASAKPKDPQIEKIRKRVLKSVKDAIAKIRKLEETCSYNDRPLSSHLNRYIKTGSYCSYTAEGDNLPPWKF